MGGAPLLLALAAVTVDYGWQPDDKGGLEYIIQIPPDQLSQTGEFTSRIDPRVRGLVSRVVIRVGEGPVKRDFGNLAPNMAQDRELAASALQETQWKQAAEDPIVRGQSGASGFSAPPSTSIDNTLRTGAGAVGSAAQNAVGSVGATVRDATGSAIGNFRNGLDTAAGQVGQTVSTAGQNVRNAASGMLSGTANNNLTSQTPTYPSTTTPVRPTTNYKDSSWLGARKARPTPSTSQYTGSNYNTQAAGTNYNAQTQRALPSTFANPGGNLSGTNEPLQYGPFQQNDARYTQTNPTQTNLQNVGGLQTNAPTLGTGQQTLAQQQALATQQTTSQQPNYLATGNRGLTNAQQYGTLQNPSAIAGGQPTYPQQNLNNNLLPGYNTGAQQGLTNNTTLALAQKELERQQLIRLAAANNNGLLSGLGPLAPAGGNAASEKSDEEDKATELLLKDRERLTGEAFELRRANDSWAQAHNQLKADHLTLQQLNDKLSSKMKSRDAFMFILIFSVVANIYLLIHLNKLIHKYRELVTNVRTTNSTSPAVQPV